MDASQQKIAQHLSEAWASEHALIGVLQSQVAISPPGSYRTALETHLEETRSHAVSVGDRLEALGQSSDPLAIVLGFWEKAIGWAVAAGKAPMDRLRVSGNEERVLAGAKAICATEAFAVATYTSIERLARSAGDEETAVMAASIRADEEKMLRRVMREIPKLAQAVGAAEMDGEASATVSTTDATTAIREARADVASHATATRKRAAPLPRAPVTALRASEPFQGYNELTEAEVEAAISAGDHDRARQTRTYELAHENRAAVIEATERQLAGV